jgi:hypothetical protein
MIQDIKIFLYLVDATIDNNNLKNTEIYFSDEGVCHALSFKVNEENVYL